MIGLLIAVAGGAVIFVNMIPAASAQTQAIVLGDQTGKVERQTTDLLFSVIVTWLSTNYELPAIFNHPEVRLVSSDSLKAMHYGADGADGGRKIEALYSADQRTIYVAGDWRSDSPANLSVLVHEMVHHLQSMDKVTFSCMAEREKLAYEAQEAWLALFGHNLLDDFQIDPLTLKLVTACF